MVDLGTLPATSLSLDDAHAKLAGWHFAKESLTSRERDILYVAEALLRELDAMHGGYARVCLSSEQAAEVSRLTAQLIRTPREDS